jgi:hypothetical protein
MFSVSGVGRSRAQSQPGAQGTTPVTASVDRTSISTDETVTLSVTVLDSEASRPTLPALQGFQVRGSSFVSQRTVVNGVATSEATYTYVLQPTQTGELTIPGIAVSLDGQTYITDPITVEVSQGAAQPPPVTPQIPGSGGSGAPLEDAESATFFAEAEVDNRSPYLGQQVNYIFRFFQAETLFGTPRYEAPDFAGFWDQQETEQSQYFIDRDGITYRVTELRTILFPTVVGERSIEAGALQFPGSLFRPGAVLRSNPVTLTVQAPPTPAPSDFSGAVGDLSISVTVEPAEVAVNEPVTLRLLIEGEGNVETLPDPLLPDLFGWRAFESTSSVSSQVQDGVLRGRKLTEQLLVPATAGEYLIPSINYTYFNPEAGSYETSSSDPIPLMVLGSEDQAPVAGVPGVERQEVEQIAGDIRFIKPAPQELNGTTSGLTGSAVYWLLWLLPPLAAFADWGWRRRQRRLESNPALVRRSRAARTARKAITVARREGRDPHQAAGRILSQYLGDKLNQPVAGLTQEALARRLSDNAIDPAMVEQVCSLMAASELGRFAPGSGDDQQAPELIGEVELLIADLEKRL